MSVEQENYANAPKSFTEARADKLESAAVWTPRDALISVLRDIDSGKISPDRMVISYTEKVNDKGFIVQNVIACPDRLTTVGLMYTALSELENSGT